MADNLGDGSGEGTVDHVGDAFDTVAMVIDYWDPSALVVDWLHVYNCKLWTLNRPTISVYFYISGGKTEKIVHMKNESNICDNVQL